MTKVVLITGASSGFGWLTSRTLLERGYDVVATMRQADGRNRAAAEELAAFAAGTAGSVLVLELDVTSDESVETAVSEALERLGRIDVAINNAGSSMSGLAEAFTAAELRDLFEVNLFGAQRLNRAVLPSMRAAGSGLLIHISSTFGRFVVPFVAPYTATKWALEALAESYSLELAGTGVDVAIVEPGAFDTGHAARIVPPADQERASSYGDISRVSGAMWASFVERLEAAAPDPQDVADALLGLIEAPAGSRPLRVVVDRVTGGGVVEDLNRTAEALGRDFFEGIGVAAPLAGRSGR